VAANTAVDRSGRHQTFKGVIPLSANICFGVRQKTAKPDRCPAQRGFTSRLAHWDPVRRVINAPKPQGRPSGKLSRAPPPEPTARRRTKNEIGPPSGAKGSTRDSTPNQPEKSGDEKKQGGGRREECPELAGRRRRRGERCGKGLRPGGRRMNGRGAIERARCNHLFSWRCQTSRTDLGRATPP